MTQEFIYPELPVSEMAFMLDGNCVGMDLKLFFPEAGKRAGSEAREACENCDVRTACLEWALKYEEYGFWAGTSREQRGRLRKQAA